MATQSSQTGRNGSKLSKTTRASSNTSLEGTQQQHRHQLVHHEAANVPTITMTKDPHLKIVCKSGSSTNKKHHGTGCEYVHIMVDGLRMIEELTVGIQRELRDQSLAARTRKPAWSKQAFVSTFWENEFHNVVTSGILAD